MYTISGNYQGGSQSVVVGENEYVAWFSNKSGNWEVLLEHPLTEDLHLVTR